jgi:hypothetical protein
VYKLSDFKSFNIGPLYPLGVIYTVLAYSKIENYEKICAE